VTGGRIESFIRAFPTMMRAIVGDVLS